ncbi:MAG: hypothetical protein HY867_04190 [Chloroflexi bacterium]|nr:hypothetical protein [Chloroflexota bacterium]
MVLGYATPSGLRMNGFSVYNPFTPSGLGWIAFSFYNPITPSGFWG